MDALKDQGGDDKQSKEELIEKMSKGEFTLRDMYKQFEKILNLGVSLLLLFICYCCLLLFFDTPHLWITFICLVFVMISFHLLLSCHELFLKLQQPLNKLAGMMPG